MSTNNECSIQIEKRFPNGPLKGLTSILADQCNDGMCPTTPSYCPFCVHCSEITEKDWTDAFRNSYPSPLDLWVDWKSRKLVFPEE